MKKSAKTIAAARRLGAMLDGARRDATGRVLVNESKCRDVLRGSGFIPLRDAVRHEDGPSIFDMALADAKARMGFK